jgi:hypothetical protein
MKHMKQTDLEELLKVAVTMFTAKIQAYPMNQVV